MLVELVNDDKVKSTTLLPKDLMKKIKVYAAENDTSITAITIEALTEFLEKRGKK